MVCILWTPATREPAAWTCNSTVSSQNLQHNNLKLKKHPDRTMLSFLKKTNLSPALLCITLLHTWPNSPFKTKLLFFIQIRHTPPPSPPLLPSLQALLSLSNLTFYFPNPTYLNSMVSFSGLKWKSSSSLNPCRFRWSVLCTSSTEWRAWEAWAAATIIQTDWQFVPLAAWR